MQENQASLDAQKVDYQQQYQREEAELAAIAHRREAQRLSNEASEAWGSYLTLRCLLERQAAQALEDRATTLDSEVEHLRNAIEVKGFADLPSPGRSAASTRRREGRKRHRPSLRRPS